MIEVLKEYATKCINFCYHLNEAKKMYAITI